MESGINKVTPTGYEEYESYWAVIPSDRSKAIAVWMSATQKALPTTCASEQMG